MKRLIVIALVILCCLAGCHAVSDRIPLELKSKAEQDIAALNASYQAQLAAKDAQIVAAHVAVNAARDAQEQAAANAFYSIDRVFGYIPSPLRTDLMMHDFALEGWAGLNHRLPDYATMLAINERITKELDATKTSLAQLQSEHDAALAANAKLSDAAKTAQDTVTTLTADKAKLTTDHDAALKVKQDALNTANDKVIATEKARADDAAAIQALKTRISLYCAAGALLCLVGAIYLPVARGVAIVIGLVLGAGGSLIWIITGPEVLAGCGVVALGAVGYLIWQHNTADKGVKAFAGLLGEKPELVAAADEWTTKYVKNADGTVTTVPDVAVQALVKGKLMAADKA